jgi:two-component system sensor histidine kinase/response regulator
MPNSRSRINKPFRFLPLFNPTLLLAALAIALLLFFSTLALRHIHASQERIIRAHLQTSLNSFSELIANWQQQNLSALQMLASSSQGKTLLTQLLRENGSNPTTHHALNEWLYPVLTVMRFDGFSVMSKDRIIVAASTEGYRQQPVQMRETKEVLDKALARRPAISRPVASIRPLEGPGGTRPTGSLMQNMCVLFESESIEPGYFCLRFNTESSFFPIFFNGRNGVSGEIYAIDNRGSFVTPPRFGAAGVSAGRAGEGSTLLGRQVRVPGVDVELGPLTDMVDFLINREAGYIKIGYPDYRGVPVAGAGRWIDEMELGIIIEQDVAEAMAPYLASRNIIIGLSVSAIVLILVLTISAIINRRRLGVREGRFSSLLDNLPAATHMTSVDHRLLVVNPAFCNLLQLDKEDILGRNIHELPVPAWLMPLIQAEQHAGADSYRRDFITELGDPEGNLRFYRIVRFPVVYAQDQIPQSFACIWVEVTDEVIASRRLAEVNQNLEHLVNERTHELMHAKDEALAASQAKASFLANMSHEIRTPLNAIIGLAHIALASNPEPRQRTYLEKMRGSGEHLLQVINDILNFSRMEAGKLTLDHSEFSVDQLIDKVVDLIWDKAAAKGLEVKLNIDKNISPRLLGDSLRLGQILINFCANAVKFTDQGSVSIRVTQVRDWQERVELLFEVEDSGIGIETEKLHNLFQPFLQVDSSSARRFEGTGLGLSICKNLAELMNARIDVKSSVGQGSCFRLRVQLEKSNRVAASIRLAQVAPTMAWLTPVNCSVLVVEDNLLNQEIMMSLLESMSAQAICVGSGLEAIAAVGQQPFDLVLMDIQLPGMDGVEATARIRELPAGVHLPIIAVTANALPGDREAYLAAGMDDYLSKPIEPAQLHRVLEQWGHACRLADTLVPRASTFEFLHNGGIDTARALHNLMNNEKLYRRLLERFAQERADFPAQLHRLWENDRPESLNQLHSLKSLAGSLGMNQLEIICFNLEQQLHAGEWDKLLVAELEKELTAMVELISRCLIKSTVE